MQNYFVPGDLSDVRAVAAKLVGARATESGTSSKREGDVTAPIVKQQPL